MSNCFIISTKFILGTLIVPILSNTIGRVSRLGKILINLKPNETQTTNKLSHFSTIYKNYKHTLFHQKYQIFQK